MVFQSMGMVWRFLLCSSTAVSVSLSSSAQKRLKMAFNCAHKAAGERPYSDGSDEKALWQ